MIEIQIAGAGAGKTHGLAEKIIKHYDASSYKKIFAITYTNNAAKNISEAVIKQLGYLPENIVVCTVHTFLLNEIIYPYSPFVLNEVHVTSSRCKTFSNFPPGKTDKQKTQETASTISRLKKKGVIHVDETYAAAWRVVDENYSKHSSQKKKSKVRKVHKLLSSAIDKIFLDEAQDLDAIALKAFQKIGENSVGIYMVGDPKQAIDYPTSFKDWLAANKANEKFKILPNITTSRRVPQRILDLSNTFCPKGQEQISLSEVDGRLTYITSKADHYDEVIRHHIDNGSLVSIFRKEGDYSTKQAGSLPEFDPEVEELLTKQLPEYEEGVVIYALQRYFSSLLSSNDNNTSIRKFLNKLEISYEKELFKKLCRSAEQYSSSKDNSAKYTISSIQRTKGLESKVCVLVLTPAILKYLMQDDVTKYNKTWNMVYVALTRAESELVVAVDMDLFGKYKHDDIVDSLESIGFKAIDPNHPSHKAEKESLMHEVELIDIFKKWNDIQISDEMLDKSLSFLKNQQNHLKCTWIGKDGNTAYLQAFDKIENYITVLSGISTDQNYAKELMLEVESRVLGLYENWRSSPSDKCIPSILENYIYVRKLLENKAGYIFDKKA